MFPFVYIKIRQVTLVCFTCIIMTGLPMSATGKPLLQVVTEHFPPFQVLSSDQKISGLTVEIMRKALDSADYPYQIEVMPWARAFTIALNQPNVVIFSIVRNQQREEQFYWLGKLRTENYYLYGLKSAFSTPFTSLEEAQKHVVVASRDSYEAKELKRLGFVEGKNLVLTAKFNDNWPMINRNRAQLTLTSVTMTKDNSEAIALWPIATNISMWAAASKGTDQQVIEKLTRQLSSQSQQSVANLD